MTSITTSSMRWTCFCQKPACPARRKLLQLDRTFTIRASEGFVEMFRGPLVAAIASAEPRVPLRFAAKRDKNAEPLREGQIDLEVGVVGASAP